MSNRSGAKDVISSSAYSSSCKYHLRLTTTTRLCIEMMVGSCKTLIMKSGIALYSSALYRADDDGSQRHPLH